MDRKLRLSLLFQASGNTKSFLGGVRTDAARTGKALGEARQRVQALQRTARDVGAFRALETRLAGTRNELAEARAEALRLGNAMDATEQPTRQLARAFEIAKHKVRALETQQAGQVRGLGDLKTKLDAAGVSTNALGAHEKRLTRDLKAANGELAEQSRRMEAVADRQRRMADARGRYDRSQQLAGSAQGAGFSAMAAGVGVGAPLLKGNDAAQDLETNMTTIAQRANLSTAATNRFEQSLLSTGKAANRTRDETLNMFDQLTAQGFEMNDALAMGRDVGRAATAYQVGDEDLAATAGSLRNIKLAANQTGAAFNVMSVAGKKGNFEFDAMARSFPSLTAGAAAYGMTGLKAVAEIAAAAQIARRGAGSDDEAATNLSNLLQKIGSPETERKFAKMGVNLQEGLRAGEAAGKSALETIIELTKQATGGDASKLGKLFEDAQVQKALRPLMADFAEFKEIRDDALNASGEVDRDFQRRMQDNAQAVKAMRIEAGGTLIRMGKDIMPVFTAISGAVGGVLRGYNSWATANPGLARGVTMVVGGVAAALLVFGGLALAVGAILGPFALLQLAWTGAIPLLTAVAGGIWTAVTAVWGFTAALLANPITWIVLGVIALAAAAYLIYRNWAPISAFFGRLWQGVRTATGNALAFLGRMFMSFSPIGLLVGAIMRAWPALQALGGRFMSLGRHLLTGLINGVLGGIPALVRAVMNAGGSIITGFKNRLGIRSPSRVFAQLGDYTMQGMGIGITRSAAQPLRRMRGVAGALASAAAIVAPGMAFAGAGDGARLDRPSIEFQGPTALARSVAPAGRRSVSASAAPVFNITVNAAPGMDEDSLVRKLLDQLRREFGGGPGHFGDDGFGEAD